jgi:serine protease SohB
LEFLTEYGLFLAKTITFLLALILVISIVVSTSMKTQQPEKGHLTITKLNDKFDDLAHTVKYVVLAPELIKAEEKAEKKGAKAEKKKRKAELKQNKTAGKDVEKIAHKKRVFVTDFYGDIKASATEELREVITAILSVATPEDEVLLRLESQGGMVHSYGLAASQLARITAKEIPLTVCVDKVAASGGYMMACVANKIISAPFAIIGSIGVVAQLPNFNRLLRKHDVDFEMFTAGKYKRTVTMFGENTDKGREKFMEDLEDTHVLFKEFITANRDKVDIEKVATGEIWFGTRALEQNLVDVIETSDQYLLGLKEEADLFQVDFVHKKTLPEKIGLNVAASVDGIITKWVQRMNNKMFT